MNRRGIEKSYRAEQILSRFRPIAPKPSSSRSALPTQAPTSNNVNHINNSSRVCKKRSSTSSGNRRSKSSPGGSTRSPVSHGLFERQDPEEKLELKTLPLLPNTPAAHSSTSSPCESTTSSSSGEPAESLTQLSLRFGDSCISRHHSTSRTGSFTLSMGSSTDVSPGATSTAGSLPLGYFGDRLFDAACPEPVALTNEKGSVVWCNKAYRELESRSEETGVPVPLYRFHSGVVLWVFWKKYVSPPGLPVWGPMKP